MNTNDTPAQTLEQLCVELEDISNHESLAPVDWLLIRKRLQRWVWYLRGATIPDIPDPLSPYQQAIAAPVATTNGAVLNEEHARKVAEFGRRDE